MISPPTENVYDSPTGPSLLIPRSSRLIGSYDSQFAFGPSRVLLIRTRLILPSGSPALPQLAIPGLGDDVDKHWGILFKAAILSTLLSVGSEAGANANESALVQALRQAAPQSINQSGQQIVSRYLNIQPTLTIRAGFPVRLNCDQPPDSGHRMLLRL